MIIYHDISWYFIQFPQIPHNFCITSSSPPRKLRRPFPGPSETSCTPACRAPRTSSASSHQRRARPPGCRWCGRSPPRRPTFREKTGVGSEAATGAINGFRSRKTGGENDGKIAENADFTRNWMNVGVKLTVCYGNHHSSRSSRGKSSLLINGPSKS